MNELIDPTKKSLQETLEKLISSIDKLTAVMESGGTASTIVNSNDNSGDLTDETEIESRFREHNFISDELDTDGRMEEAYNYICYGIKKYLPPSGCQNPRLDIECVEELAGTKCLAKLISPEQRYPLVGVIYTFYNINPVSFAKNFLLKLLENNPELCIDYIETPATKSIITALRRCYVESGIDINPRLIQIVRYKQYF